MGDVAMTVPVILALVNQYPEVKITMVSRPFFKPIFENIPNVTFLSVHTNHQHKGIFGLFRLYRELKSKKVDQVADLHNVLRSKVIRTLFALSGKKVAFTDKGRKEKKELTRAENKIFKPLKSMFERHVETFKQLGYDIDLSNPVFLRQMDIPLKAQKIIGNKNQKWIGIAPFAHYDSKTYPMDLMREVIRKLSEDQNQKILLFGGGKQEMELLEEFANENENVFNFAGKISFEDELHLISNLDLMVSMDSGNAHLAAMFGVKVVTLWGATHPFAGFTPFNQPLENCLVSDREKFPLLPTSVYGNKKVAGYHDVMRSISVEKVVFSVQSQLAE
jgi:ADP-heptose:LPS heptosyltransferase